MPTRTRGHARALNTPLSQTGFAVDLIGQDHRGDLVHRLVGYDLDVVVRAAGLLLLLLAQSTARITQLTTGHVTDDGTNVAFCSAACPPACRSRWTTWSAPSSSAGPASQSLPVTVTRDANRYISTITPCY